MRKYLAAAVSLAALAGAAGVAVAQGAAGPGEREFAQNDQHPEGRSHRLFGADANNDGVVTRQEFDAQRATHFASLDADNNGQLTREEMRAGRQERRGRHGERGGGGFGLARADANEDGNITRDEFLARPIEHFDRLDANDDGVISAAERPQRPTPEQRAERREERRGERPNPDTNGDQLISRDEFAAMGTAMFQRLDANGDGRITQEEAEAGRPHRRDRDRG